VAKVGVAFARKTSKTRTFQKKRQTPSRPREKLLRRAGLVLQIFFPEFENYFEADFLGVKVCDVFASRQPLEKSPTLTPKKSHLK